MLGRCCPAQRRMAAMLWSMSASAVDQLLALRNMQRGVNDEWDRGHQHATKTRSFTERRLGALPMRRFVLCKHENGDPSQAHLQIFCSMGILRGRPHGPENRRMWPDAKIRQCVA